MSEPHEEFEIMFSDLHDGVLSANDAARLRAHLAECAACKVAYAEFEETMGALREMKRRSGATEAVAAPDGFVKGVEETIHKRSAGRFFGRKTLGDRVPFGVLLVAALVLMVVVGALLWGSTTGSLR
jgi:anti-sigma factor RsiW